MQLLRTAALAASARTGWAEVAAATQHIVAATAQLSVIDGIERTAGGIQKSALSIEGDCTKATAAIRRSLDHAVAALGGIGINVDEAGATGAA